MSRGCKVHDIHEVVSGRVVGSLRLWADRLPHPPNVNPLLGPLAAPPLEHRTGHAVESVSASRALDSSPALKYFGTGIWRFTISPWAPLPADSPVPPKSTQRRTHQRAKPSDEDSAPNSSTPVASVQSQTGRLKLLSWVRIGGVGLCHSNSTAQLPVHLQTFHPS